MGQQMRVDWGGLCAALQIHCTQVQDHAMQLQCTTATSCHPHCAPTQPHGSLPSPQNACIIFIFKCMLYMWICKIADMIKEAQARVSLYLDVFSFTLPCSASFQTGWVVWQHWRTYNCWLCHSGRDRKWLLLLSVGRDSTGPLYTAVEQLWAEDAWSRDRGDVLLPRLLCKTCY